MSLSGVTFSGLSSGIDTDSIISRLVQLESQPITRLQTQQIQLQAKKALYDGLKSRLASLSSSSIALNNANALNLVTANSSDTAVATISASGTANAGTFNLTVSKLATTHKITSSPQTNASDPMGLTGKLVINGKGVTIESTDTLTQIASKINAGGSVVASIIDGGTGSAYLSLTSKSSGADGEIQIADLDGTVADTLGLANGALDYRETITGGVTSASFSSQTTAYGSMMGFTGEGTQTFNLNGTDISVDLDSDSLEDIAATINGSGSGVTASVRSVTENGTTKYKLDLTGVSSYTDADGVLQGLGILQKGYGSELVAAQDASYSLDGVNLTSSTNTIANVISGTTITLLKANETTPEKATLSLTKDDAAIKQKVNDFVSAYNNVVDFISANSKFDSETFESGGLFGDSVAQSVESQLANGVFSTVSGLTGSITNLTNLGLSFGDDGKITVDDAKLTAAVADNVTGVSAVFRAMGSSTNSALSYVTAGSKVKPSGEAGYQVNITTAALQHALEASTSQTSNLSVAETLTFNGKLFGSTDYNLVLEAGLSQTQVMDKINADAKLSGLVTASIDGGKLKIESKKYGSSAEFTVASDQAAASDTTGLGTNSIVTQGTDVAGTINGEAATGTGQLLVGNSGNTNTDGLQLLYTGTATGTIGNMVYTKGIAPLISDLVSTFTDPTGGLLTVSNKALDDQNSNFDDQIAKLQAHITDYQTQLKLKFSRMEEALSKLQSQGSQLSAAFAQSKTS